VLDLLEQSAGDVEVHRQLADLALGLGELAILHRPRPNLQALTAGGEKLLTPLRDPPGRLAGLAGEQMQRLPAQQPQDHLLLGPLPPSIPASMTPDMRTSWV